MPLDVTAIVIGAQDTVSDLASNLAEVVLGGQETVRSVAGSAAAVPGSVAQQVAGPAAEAAMAPFQTITYLGLGLLVAGLADELLASGKVRRGILGM